MLQQLGIRQRFHLLLVFSLACFALCGAIVYHTLSEIRVNGPLYQRIMQGQDLVADILPPPAYILESYLVTLQMEAAPDAARRRPLAERLRQLESEYQARLRHWREAGLTGELASSFLVDSDALVREFYVVAWRGWGVRTNSSAPSSAAWCNWRRCATMPTRPPPTIACRSWWWRWRWCLR